MSDYVSLSDVQQLGSNDQIRVNVTFGCQPISKITADDIRNFLVQQQNVKSVLDVTENWSDWVTIWDPFTCRYAIILNPKDGVTAGDIRNDTYTALRAANETHVVKSDAILVGLVERLVKPGILGSIGDAIKPGPSTAVTFAALAIIVVVGFLVFNKVVD